MLTIKVCLLISLCIFASVKSAVVDTVSGSTYRDGTGAAVSFSGIGSQVLDSTGQYLYVADTNNHAIRRVQLSTSEFHSLTHLLNFVLQR